MTFIRSNAGINNSVPKINTCPLNMEALSAKYENSTATPTIIVDFDGARSGLTTDVNMALTPLGNCTGKEILPVVGCSGCFETSAPNFYVSNLHKLGAARSSEIWVAIPDNVVVIRLIQKSHQGAVDTIRLVMLSYVDAGGVLDQPRVIQEIEYSSCFITLVDNLTYYPLTVIAFSFVQMQIIHQNINPISNNGKNENGKNGMYVYAIDYGAGAGTSGG